MNEKTPLWHIVVWHFVVLYKTIDQLIVENYFSYLPYTSDINRPGWNINDLELWYAEAYPAYCLPEFHTIEEIETKLRTLTELIYWPDIQTALIRQGDPMVLKALAYVETYYDYP